MIRVSNGQLLGQRENQQDYFAWFTIGDMTIAILADGMGGYLGGETASVGVINTFKQEMDISLFQNIPADLHSALNVANQYLAQLKIEQPDLKDMGTTLLALVVRDNQLWWLSVGDSPLYRVNEHKITRLNAQHHYGKILDQAVVDNELSLEEAQNDPNYHALSSAVIGEPIPDIDCPDKPMQLEVGDVLILSSDGINTLSENEIEAIVVKQQKEHAIVEQLLTEVGVKNKGFQDNVTVVVLNLEN